MIVHMPYRRAVGGTCQEERDRALSDAQGGRKKFGSGKG